MAWQFNGKNIEDVPSSSIGFIYKITHLPTGRWYIGRKMLTKNKTPQSKGVKNKAKVKSDWEDYWSSSELLKHLVIEHGEDKFHREILLFCETRAGLTLSEEYCLHVSGALFDPLSLNNNIRAKIFRKWFMKTPNLFNELKKLKL